MKIVIFGLSISSSWGNGHATLWRALCGALIRRGHQVHFFERDVPYYANHRDLKSVPGGHLHLYPSWEAVSAQAAAQLADADVAIVTSYCPDALAAADLVHEAGVGLSCFYDLDTPVTLSRLESGQPVDYIGPRGLRDFDLVLSYTGGKALSELQSRLGARRVEPLYGSVDPDHYFPVIPQERFKADLSYLGTYAEDRQASLEQLFVEPARTLPDHRFVIGGAMYPGEFPWTRNIFFVRHLPPPEHPAFYCSSRLTLNVTRRAMADMGYCPSGRLFEAAACGVAILTDSWEGLDQFFQPGSEILIARNAQDAVECVKLRDYELAKVARRARERTLDCHTAQIRALDFENAVASRSVVCGA
jgi:spore maturation protein CgeB